MFKILIFLGSCIIVPGTSFNQFKQKRSLYGDVRIVSSLPPPSYGYGSPWSRNKNPWKSFKISSDLYESSSGISYGSARPPPPSPSIVVTKHLIVEKPVHVPVPVEKYVPVTVEKSVPVAVPQIIPYPVERPSPPIRQIGIPVPIIIAPQGLLVGSGSAPSPPPASPAPSPSPPPPPPPPPPPAPVPVQPVPQQLYQGSGTSNPISFTVSAGLSGIPFQIPVQMLPANAMPVQMMQSPQIPVQMIQSPQAPVQMVPSNQLSVQVVPNPQISYQILPSSPVSRGLFHGIDSSLAQLPTFEAPPNSIQGNSLAGFETLAADDWKYD